MNHAETRQVVELSIEQQIFQLNNRYARCLDEDRLEEWPKFFVEDCRYLIHPRENFRLGLEGYLLYFDNNAMLRDRVTSLREANLYSIHQDRHFVSGVALDGCVDNVYHTYASYQVIQTDVDGHARVFSVGEYRDQLVMTTDGLKFKERQVIVDNFNVEGMIAVPL